MHVLLAERFVSSVNYNVLTETFETFLVISYMMEKVDLVLVGAEGVVESGGIINKVSAKLSLCRL